MRPTLFNYIATRDEFETYTNELFGFITKDKLDVRIHEVYPLAEVARAHEVGFSFHERPNTFVADSSRRTSKDARRPESCS